MRALFPILAIFVSSAPLHAGEWRPLFNGKDLEGWDVLIKDGKPGEDPDRYVTVADGEIHGYATTPETEKVRYGVIMTKESFRSYHLKLDYRWGTKKFAPRNKPEQKRDAGILYHVWNPTKVWPGSLEYQIQETDTGDLIFIDAGGSFFHEPGDPKKFLAESAGGIARYGFARNTWQLVAKREVADRLEGWNTSEVIVREGKSATHIVNGEPVLELSNFVRPDGDKTVPLDSGRIALQFEGAEIFYRNIMIRELPPAVEVTPASLAFSTILSTPADQATVIWKGVVDFTPVIEGRDAGNFAFAPETGGARVSFDPKGQTGNFHAALRVGPETVVPLHGLATRAFEGENEAPLFQVARALALPVDIGAETLITPKDGKPLGSGIAATRFRAAGDLPVVFTPLARYSPPWELPLGIYQDIDGRRKLTEAGRLADSTDVKNAHQRLLPPFTETSADPLKPTGSFGIYCTSPTHTAFSDPALNGDNVKSIPNALRVYPVTEILGRRLSNAYLLCFEEAKNGDYQDYVFLIENVVAEP